MSRLFEELTKTLTREQYEAERLAEPCYEDGEVKPTWEQLLAVEIKGELGTYRGIIFTEKSDALEAERCKPKD